MVASRDRLEIAEAIESITADTSSASPFPLSQKSRNSRESKRSKRLKRQQPERKEKHSNGQRRAYHEQQHEISKLRATHDAQHQRRQTIQTEGPLKLSHFPSHGAISLEAKSRATAPQNKIYQLVVSDRTGRPIDTTSALHG